MLGLRLFRIGFQATEIRLVALTEEVQLSKRAFEEASRESEQTHRSQQQARPRPPRPPVARVGTSISLGTFLCSRRLRLVLRKL